MPLAARIHWGAVEGPNRGGPQPQDACLNPISPARPFLALAFVARPAPLRQRDRPLPYAGRGVCTFERSLALSAALSLALDLHHVRAARGGLHRLRNTPGHKPCRRLQRVI